MDVALQITENSQVAEARRRISSHAADLGFSETKLGALAIVITEMATNLVKHAEGGELVVRAVASSGDVAGIELIALDKGPGMRDVAECLRDGYSTSGSPGTGMGAITRMSDDYDLYSLPGRGTAVMARLWAGSPGRSKQKVVAAEGLSIPMQGELACGDAWSCAHVGEELLVIAADGLGHGPLAATAARTAVEAFHESAHRDLTSIIGNIHAALRSTRGAAVAVARINPQEGSVRYAGVGNIASMIYTPEKAQRMVSHNGTLGHEVRKIQEFTYTWPADATLVMHSDGISTQLSFETYPGILARHPSLIAATLYRDFTRGRDDSTVVIAQEMEL